MSITPQALEDLLDRTGGVERFLPESLSPDTMIVGRQRGTATLTIIVFA
jgi:hypothetical protein